MQQQKLESLKNLYSREIIDEFYPFISQDIKNELYNYNLDQFKDMTESDVIQTIKKYYGEEWIEVNTND
tara:strand:+ start:261 stop:467 length:207 start_codon:yes stop_codon:yes gene_type:complete